jgi:hypothetical protein
VSDELLATLYEKVMDKAQRRLEVSFRNIIVVNRQELYTLLLVFLLISLKLVAELQKEFMLLNPPSSLLPMLQVQPH